MSFRFALNMKGFLLIFFKIDFELLIILLSIYLPRRLPRELWFWSCLNVILRCFECYLMSKGNLLFSKELFYICQRSQEDNIDFGRQPFIFEKRLLKKTTGNLREMFYSWKETFYFWKEIKRKPFILKRNLLKVRRFPSNFL